MSDRKVVKFGGTSVANYSAMLTCCGIVADDPERCIVVLSAPAGVTNALVALANEAPTKRKQHIETIQSIVIAILKECEDANIEPIRPLTNEINQLLAELTQHALAATPSFSDAQIDTLLSFGERFSTAFCTAIYNASYGSFRPALAINFDVRQVLITDDTYGQAEPKIEAIGVAVNDLLVPLLDQHIVMTQGFVGKTHDNFTTTLGRGGSDYTAALLSEAVNAKRCEIWTDVAGVYSTDPRIDSRAKPLSELSYDEAAEMANFGAKVLHPATLSPTLRSNIPVFVGSSRSPELGGTVIVKDCQHEPSFRAVTRRCHQELVTIHTPKMKGANGFMSEVFAILDEYDVSVDLITTSEVAIALTFDKPLNAGFLSSSTKNALEALRRIADVTVDENLDLITIVGNHLHTSAGLSAQIFSALQSVKIRMVCYGANPHNLSFLVDSDASEETVIRLHEALILSQ